MALNTLGLVAGIAVARREGVASDQVARVALPAAVIPNLGLGVVVADRLAKEEAAAEAAAAPTPRPQAAAGQGTSGVSGTGSGPAPSGPSRGQPVTTPAPVARPQPLTLPIITEAPPPPGP